MHLWQPKSSEESADIAARVFSFTAGNDRHWDLQLAPWDVVGSLAHITMLGEVGLLSRADVDLIRPALQAIYQEVNVDGFSLRAQAEDIHSHVEQVLTERIGEAGMRIHTARSRNDQVLVDLRLFLRAEWQAIIQQMASLSNAFAQRAAQHQHQSMPGYTHLQLAMPSSFGLWFGAYAESLVNDIQFMQGVWQVVNRNPLGSAAGYGSSFPINRQRTSDLLGFDGLDYNVVYAQMGRGKTERLVAYGIANLAATLGKWAMDVTLFLNQHFALLRLPSAFTTGSSIMPHKQNPDVFELIRARCNVLQALPNTIALATSNLPSGYHRDFQELKEVLFPALADMRSILSWSAEMVMVLEVVEDAIERPGMENLYTVERVHALVQTGMPFREAYRVVSTEVADGSFVPPREIPHTHEGSRGDLGLDQLHQRLQQILASFNFEQVETNWQRLLQ
jgi:argininosuccinate lyase